MGLFDPQWIKLVRPTIHSSSPIARGLGDLRKQLELDHGAFASLLVMRVGWLNTVINAMAGGFRGEYPAATDKQMLVATYLLWIFVKRFPLPQRYDLTTHLRVRHTIRDGIQSGMRNADNIEDLKNIATPDDLTRFIISTDRMYDNLPSPVVRTLRTIDKHLGWNDPDPYEPMSEWLKTQPKFIPFLDEIVAALSKENGIMLLRITSWCILRKVSMACRLG